jgi:endonuclease/exonuclease/phosphatase family metal-dependent hydrolase
VQVVHLNSGREFVFLNTHFDYVPSAIDESARLLRGWIAKTTESHPIIVTGDFNADKNSSAYHQLTSAARLMDVFRQVHTADENEATFHGYGQAGDPIDWILASDSFEVVSAKIDRYHADDLYPSDHYPLHAELNWKS